MSIRTGYANRVSLVECAGLEPARTEPFWTQAAESRLAVLIEVARVEADQRIVDSASETRRVAASKAAHPGYRTVRGNGSLGSTGERTDRIRIGEASEVDRELLAERCGLDAFVDREARVVDRDDDRALVGTACCTRGYRRAQDRHNQAANKHVNSTTRVCRCGRPAPGPRSPSSSASSFVSAVEGGAAIR